MFSLVDLRRLALLARFRILLRLLFGLITLLIAILFGLLALVQSLLQASSLRGSLISKSIRARIDIGGGADTRDVAGGLCIVRPLGPLRGGLALLLGLLARLLASLRILTRMRVARQNQGGA